MDANLIGILRMRCFDNKYESICKRIWNSHIHHEYDDKMLNIWDKANYSNPLHRDPKNKTKRVVKNKQKMPSKAEANPKVKTMKSDHKCDNIADKHIYILTKKECFYLLRNNKVKQYSITNCPQEIKAILESEAQSLVAFNTSIIASFFRNSGIKVNCTIDVRLYLQMNDFYFSKLNDLAKSENIKLNNVCEELRYLQKCFLRLENVMTKNKQEVLENIVLPYNTLMNEIVCNTLHLNSKVFNDIYSKKNKEEQETLTKYFPSSSSYNINSFGITKTFRFTTKSNNFQGLPINAKDEVRDICKSIIPSSKDTVFIDIDFKHMDISSIAYLSQDPTLIGFIQSKKDVYVEIAKLLLEKDNITDKERKCVKELVLSFIYGASRKSIALKIQEHLGYNEQESISQAKTMQKLFDTHFSQLIEYKQKVHYNCKVDGCIETLFGNKIEMPPKKVYTCAMNNIVQSTSSFIFINFTLDIINKCKENDIYAKLVMQRHDELLFEVNSSQIREFIQIIEDKCVYSKVSKLPMWNTLCLGNDYHEIIEN